jgi:hypothetical protein
MSLFDRRHPWLWVTIVAVALLLLAGILITVITLSARLRRAERVTVIETIPVQTPTATTAPAPAEDTPSDAAVTAVPATTDDKVAGYRAKQENGSDAPAQGGAKPVRGVEKPVVVVQKPAPTKVIEKVQQVKVVEKQVKVVEKPETIVQKPAAGSDSAAGEGTFRDTGLPNQMEYDGQRWNASERVRGLPADLLIAGTEEADGRTVYHDHNAARPYPHVYLPVPGGRDLYVRYVPTAR